MQTLIIYYLLRPRALLVCSRHPAGVTWTKYGDLSAYGQPSLLRDLYVE